MSSAPPSSKRPPRAEVRQRLFDAAAGLFATYGIGGVSADRISAAAGFSKGAFYSNFASKEDLIVQLVEKLTGEQLASATTNLRTDLSLEEMLLSLQSELAPMTAHRRQMFALASEFRLQAERDPAVREAFIRGRRGVHDSVRGVMTRWLAAHPQIEPAVPVPTLTTIVVAVIMGMAFDAPYLNNASSGEVLAVLLAAVATPHPQNG